MRRPVAWHASEKLQGLIAVSEHGALDVQARLLIRSIPGSFYPYTCTYSYQSSLGGRTLRCWYLVRTGMLAPWVWTKKDTIWRALSILYHLASFLCLFVEIFSPRGDIVFSASARIAMAANNRGPKAAQPTASKRAAAAQADLSMSFPRCVVWRVKVSALWLQG